MSDMTSAQAPLIKLPLFSGLFNLLRSGTDASIYVFLLLVVALVVVAVATWGLPALGLIGVTLTPIYMVVLLIISRG